MVTFMPQIFYQFGIYVLFSGIITLFVFLYSLLLTTWGQIGILITFSYSLLPHDFSKKKNLFFFFESYFVNFFSVFSFVMLLCFVLLYPSSNDSLDFLLLYC